MTAMKRQILTGVFFAFGFLILFSVLYLFAFPIDDWSLLWRRQIWNLPFVFIVPVLALSAGAAAGVLSGFFWRNALMSVSDAVDGLTEGLATDVSGAPHLEELENIQGRLSRLAGQMALQAQQVQKMSNAKAEAEEAAIEKIVSEERNRLARELHDSVSQQLFAASMLMSTINELRPSVDDPESKQLRLVEATIHQAQLEMRALFLHLRPIQLHGKALKDGMEGLLGELRQKVPMKISWHIEPITLEKGIEDQLFRILQESVSNTLRHARAKSLDVLLIRREKWIIMRVTDDGTGFRPKETKPGSYGLQNMKERASQIGGQLKLVSVPGKGTSLEVKVPVLKEDEGND
ncbi:sensor histidine kinase [Sporolactobacillus sp. THM19-2]|uniref:sensor histidine kinase n=1 Tax=Sporolactobacillus sp. THM19-2 TaxID=2511171 RepID=UPI00101FECEE|nr:sensor histidine kinase [Sporolactobacillus sp. THM19-2]RYL88913.1 sensor histidine kinase [Sporolactobacillus sp. THM19-2]